MKIVLGQISHDISMNAHKKPWGPVYLYKVSFLRLVRNNFSTRICANSDDDDMNE